MPFKEFMFYSFYSMCGICGIVKFNVSTAKNDTCKMLNSLRHRGYDSWGISEFNSKIDTTYFTRSSDPLIFDDYISDAEKAKGNICFSMGHTRYTTQGSSSDLNQAQPLRSANGNIALIHNGQVKTSSLLKQGQSDSHFILELLENEFGSLSKAKMDRMKPHQIEKRFNRIFLKLNGSYACIAQIKGLGMFAFRDNTGIRPLVFRRSGEMIEFASESCAFISEGVTNDVAPGEVIWIKWHNAEFYRLHPFITECVYPAPCLFEFIYLANDSSIIDGILVRDARKKMGELMIQQVIASGLQIDTIVPIPHTPLLAGRELADGLGVGYTELLEVHNTLKRSESRTFILPTQADRELAVINKFGIASDKISECRDKNILVLDDSIVRGTTLKQVVKLLRQHVQPKNIYVASLAPPIISPNVFGIDIPTCTELVAFSDIETDIPKVVQNFFIIDAPVIYQKLSILKQGLSQLSVTGVSGFEDSCFLSLKN